MGIIYYILYYILFIMRKTATEKNVWLCDYVTESKHTTHAATRTMSKHTTHAVTRKQRQVTRNSEKSHEMTTKHTKMRLVWGEVTRNAMAHIVHITIWIRIKADGNNNQKIIVRKLDVNWLSTLMLQLRLQSYKECTFANLSEEKLQGCAFLAKLLNLSDDVRNSSSGPRGRW